MNAFEITDNGHCIESNTWPKIELVKVMNSECWTLSTNTAKGSRVAANQRFNKSTTVSFRHAIQ